MANADHYLASWIYYQFKGFGDYSTQYGTNDSVGMYSSKGVLDYEKYRALARTYAYAV